MDMNAFNAAVVRSQDTVWDTYDIRPFGDDQNEAVYCFFSDIAVQIQAGQFAIPGSPPCVLHDRRLDMSRATWDLLVKLRARGVPMNFVEKESQSD